MSSIAVVAPDLSAGTASGAGLRSVGIARELARYHDVHLLASGDSGLQLGNARLISDRSAQQRSLRDSSAVIGANLLTLRQLALVRGKTIFDLYDPMLIANLTKERLSPLASHLSVSDEMWLLSHALRHGNHVLCANRAQRDLYLGMLIGNEFRNRRLSFDEDSLSQRIIVLPNGAEELTLPSRHQAREELGLPPDGVVLLWGGGIWDWLDPISVLRAFTAAVAQAPELCLVFLGIQRDGYADPFMSNSTHFRSLCESTGLVGSNLFINNNWVNPHQRLSYLSASDAGILGQGDYIEANFSFRTRLMDCISSGIPVLALGTDPLTNEGVEEGWAVRHRIGDSAGLASALVRFARDQQWRCRLVRAARSARAQRTWAHTVRPLQAALGPTLGTPDDLPRRRARQIAILSEGLRRKARRAYQG